MLFSIQAFSTPLYVKLESDGDIIFSHTPIAETKSDTVSKKKSITTKDNVNTKPSTTEVRKENIQNAHNVTLNTDPIIAEATKENKNNTHPSKNKPITVEVKKEVVMVNTKPITAEAKKENIQNIPPATASNKPLTAEATKESVKNTQKPRVMPFGLPVMPISLPNNIPSIASATEENMHVNQKSHTDQKPSDLPNNKPTMATDEKIHVDLPSDADKKPATLPNNKAAIAEITPENITKPHKPDVKAKAIIKPQNKSVIVDTTDENTDKAKKSVKTRTITLPKNKAMVAKNHKRDTQTKLVQLPKNQPMMAKTTKENKNKSPRTNMTNTAYKTFRITYPLNKEVIQDLSLLVDLKIEPKLLHNHQIQLFVDGKRINKPSNSMHINTNIAKKGSHEIYGLIIDKNKNFVMQSNVITVYIQKIAKALNTMETTHQKASKIMQTAHHLKPVKTSKITQAAHQKQIKASKMMQTAHRQKQIKATKMIQASHHKKQMKAPKTMQAAQHKVAKQALNRKVLLAGNR